MNAQVGDVFGSGGGRRCVVALRLRRLASAVALATVPAMSMSMDVGAWQWSSQGLLDIRARSTETNATQLVPEPERVGPEPRRFATTTALSLQGWNGPLTATAAGRLFARTHRREDERAAGLRVDELHAEYALTPVHFLYGGRRHVVHGRSLGVNPLDIAIDPVDLDQALDSDRRRAEIEGQDLFGFESLLGDRFTLTGYRTPGERSLLAGAFTMPEWNADLTMLAFDDDERPGAGLSLSHTLGEALLAYADVVVRRGRDRAVVRADRGPDPVPGAWFVEEGDASRHFAQSSVGLGYTLDSGATFNLEYYFDANGYSDREWGEITGLIADNDRIRDDERRRESATGNLLRLSGHLRRLTLRRHYGFFRAQHPGLFGRALAAELTVLHNLADRTGSLGLRLERETAPDVFLGVEGRWLYGDDLDEFALRPGELSGSVHVTVNF
ncbi:MAG: hypothetical protein OXC25_02545 [Thiotrichales bacterium]|nr:hypothetical protein [Thiotrichales bacterium]